MYNHLVKMTRANDNRGAEVMEKNYDAAIDW